MAPAGSGNLGSGACRIWLSGKSLFSEKPASSRTSCASSCFFMVRYTIPMKLLLKNFTLRHYIHYMRRRSKHVQHLHAMAFAGIVTSLIAGIILYTDYGFWHETYRREPDALISEEPVSLSGSFGRFMDEARANFQNLGDAGAGLLEGKETYSKEGQE